MSLETLVTFRVEIPAGWDRLDWCQGKSFCLPVWALRQSGLSDCLESSGTIRLRPGLPVNDPQVAEAVRLHTAFTDKAPVSSRLPVSYQWVPPWLRSALASLLGRWQRRNTARWAAFPRWPLDLSADFLADVVDEPKPFAGGPTPVLLTHDLDSPEGLENLVRFFLDREEAVGARSTSYIVPCAWPIDRGLLVEVKERGHGLGVHGFDHGNRTAFVEPPERRQRLDSARFLWEQHGADGYRAPSLLRTRDLLHDLADRYRYDSSIPTSGGLFPVPNNGCASARPFRVEGIVEIPLSMPRDGSLRFLGHSPREIADLWIKCADEISASGGVVVLLTHCEARFSGSSAMLDAYRALPRPCGWLAAICLGDPGRGRPSRFTASEPEQRRFSA